MVFGLSETNYISLAARQGTDSKAFAQHRGDNYRTAQGSFRDMDGWTECFAIESPIASKYSFVTPCVVGCLAMTKSVEPLLPNRAPLSCVLKLTPSAITFHQY